MSTLLDWVPGLIISFWISNASMRTWMQSFLVSVTKIVGSDELDKGFFDEEALENTQVQTTQ